MDAANLNLLVLVLVLRPSSSNQYQSSTRTKDEDEETCSTLPGFKACLKIRFGAVADRIGVRPSSGAATLEKQPVWIFRARGKCPPCCARGRAHSESVLFKQALRD